MQSDCEGHVGYGTCKLLLKIIGDTKDNAIYGYAGWKNPAKLSDFVEVLQECVDKKCDLIWR